MTFISSPSPCAVRPASSRLAWLAGFVLLLAGLLPGAARAQAPTFTEALSLNPDGFSGTSTGQATAFDAAGNQYVTGYFVGTIALGSTTLASAGNNDLFVAKRSAATGAWLWAVRMGSPGNEVGTGIAVDANGNALVTGFFQNTVSFATSPAATSLASAGSTDVFVAKFAAASGACAWAVRAGGTGDEQGNGIAVDGSGNALVTGFFNGTASFATSPTATSLAAAGGNDIFVAKFAGASGAATWAVRAGSGAGDQGTGIAVDGSGDALVTGSFANTASFASSSTTTISLTSTGGQDVFVAKFAGATGAAAWAVRAGAVLGDAGTGIAVDGSGNALVTGSFNLTVSFATSPTATSLASAGSNDIFVAKFAAGNGACAWAVRAGGTGSDQGQGIAADGSGNALVTGYFNGTATFATSPTATSLAAASGQDVFVAKFAASNGAPAWAVRGGGFGNDVGYGLAVDGSGNASAIGSFQGTATFASPNDAVAPGQALFVARLDGSTGAWQAPALANNGGGSSVLATALDAAGNQYVTGYFSGAIVLGGTTLVGFGSNDIFVAKRSAATGAWLWAVRAGGASIDQGTGIAVDASGNVLVTGFFNLTASFATSPAATSLTAAGSTDVFVAKFAATDGACAWAVRGGSSGDDQGTGIAVDGSGDAFVTGYFNGTASFATSPVATSLTSAGGQDIFVAKFAGTSGAAAWAVRVGSNRADTGQGIAVDASGDALVTGTFNATVSFATSPSTAISLTTTGNQDVFVAKLAGATGAATWAVRAGGASDDQGNSIVVDGSGDVLVTGYIQSTASFATSPAATSLTSAGSNDIFVAKFAASNGACAWAVRAGGSGGEQGNGIAVDGSGDALVTGYFNGTATFATSPTATSLAAAGGNDVFVAKFAGASGAAAWAVRGGNTADEASTSIAVDGSGSALVAGSFNGRTILGSYALQGGNGTTAFVGRVGVPVPKPAITSFSPLSGPVGTPVTITGTNLGSAGSVSFNGTAQTTFVSNSATEIVLLVPAGATTGTLTVTTANGTSAASSQPFTVCPAPVALAQNVTLTLDAGGTAALTAAQVNNGSTASCGAAPASALRVSPSSFTCANLGPNTVTLTVTDAAGTTATATATVTVSPPALASTTWTGAADNDPANCANWSYGQLPTAAISAVIPANLTNYPALNAGTLAAQDLTVAGGAAFALGSGATLALTGNLLNSGAATFGGTVRLVGSAATQTLSHGGSFATVVVHKPSGTVQLGQDLAIDGSLTLTSGTLTTTGSYRVALGSAATISESEASYVLGLVVVSRPLSPGTAEPFAGLGLTLTPAAGSTAPGATLVTRTTGTAISGAGSSQSIRRYFDIVPAVNAGLNVTLDFAYFDHELNGIPAARLVLFKSVSGGAPWVPQPGTTAAGNVVTKTGIADFSVWTLGNAANPLPVELTAFTATPAGPSAVRLAWATASERNSLRFAVERSLDGVSFARVGTMAAAGMSSNARAYELLDARLPGGAARLYYRLKQVDADGSFSYSPVRSVALSGAVAGLALFPNPAPGGAATLTGAAPGAAVTVMDALGRPVATATADASGTAALVLPAGLPAGVYVVRAGSRAVRLTVE